MNDEAATAPDATLAPAEDLRLVLCTAPPGAGRDLARALVDERLAACVNLVPGLRSVYRWEDALCDDPETLLLVKTTAGSLDALAARLRELHTYEVPELLAFAPDCGLGPYLAWAREATAPPEE